MAYLLCPACGAAYRRFPSEHLAIEWWTRWTDHRVFHATHPPRTGFSRCARCGTFFLAVPCDARSLSPAALSTSMSLPEPDEASLLEALDAPSTRGEEELLQLRVDARHLANDAVRVELLYGVTSRRSVATNARARGNLQALLELLVSRADTPPCLAAEAARELGDFDRARALLGPPARTQSQCEVFVRALVAERSRLVAKLP